MNKVNCIIVDDEPLALDILEGYIRLTPGLELEGRFTSGADALKLLRARGREGGRGIDLAFLDIQMPGLGGIDLAKTISAEEWSGHTRVVFTTAFPQYALDGFRVDALDYLLKPISFSEFTRAAKRAVDWFDIKRAAGNAGSGSASSTPESPQTLIVKSDYKQFVIPTSTITYAEAIRDYIRIHTLDAAGRAGSIQTLMNLKTLEETLPSDRFARVHRSYIVALDRVKRIERRRVILECAGTPYQEVSIPVSDTFKDSFSRALAARAL